VRGYHWNVKGPQFFELHTKFEEFYTDLLTKVDEVAERILTLGHTPVHAYSDYVTLSRIAEDKGVHEGRACVRGVLEGYQTLIELQRELLALASDADDEGTAAQVGDYIREQEKTVWMAEPPRHSSCLNNAACGRRCRDATPHRKCGRNRQCAAYPRSPPAAPPPWPILVTGNRKGQPRHIIATAREAPC